MTEVAAIEGDIEGVSAAANEAPVGLPEAQSSFALSQSELMMISEPVVEAPVEAVVSERADNGAVSEPAPVEVSAAPTIEQVVDHAAPVQVEVPAPAVMSVDEMEATEVIRDEVQPEPAPAHVEPVVVEAAPAPLNDSSESTLVRAMASFGSTPIEQAPAPAPVAEVPAPPAAAPVISAVDLKSSLDASGLVLVETQSAAAPVEVEQVQLGRRRRQAPVIPDEPMQQVETRD